MSTNPSAALITGGTSGIGRSVADKLAALGIRVIVVRRNAERGQKTVAEIRAAEGKADFISSDLGTRRARAKWPDERSSSEAAMLIFSSTMPGSIHSGRRMK